MQEFEIASRFSKGVRTVYVDIDETICFYEDIRRYDLAIPNQSNIQKINQMYEHGWSVVYWTARGSSSGIDYYDITMQQLKDWGCMFNKLICGKEKGSFDMVIDDKAKRIEELPSKVGFTSSAFDIIHPGHIRMLEDCKTVCDHLVIGLQSDPTIDRPDTKNKPIQSLEERREMISAIKHVDEVIVYHTEADLIKLIKEVNPDIRIIGSDWKGKEVTGADLVPIHWHERNHNFSTTNLRKRIAANEK
tara:strand:+ start:516 stop:1256 length:741 start_codon:yes stop_codon:yes gene_type:complete